MMVFNTTAKSFLVLSLRVAAQNSLSVNLKRPYTYTTIITKPRVINSLKTFQIRLLRSKNKDTDWMKMVDPARVVSYEDVVKLVQLPEKLIIDVRNPDEVSKTGKIPSSINIPLGNVQESLSLSDEEFSKQYQRRKPSASDELVFYCHSGRRSAEALDKALQLGYSKYVITPKLTWGVGQIGLAKLNEILTSIWKFWT